MASPYLIMYGLFLAVMFAVAYYIYNLRKNLDEMHGMMVGMTLGMLSGLIAGTFYTIPTGNFLNGIILGSIAGLAFGAPIGRLSGHLGIMEGVMAGPMGGMMGAMLGQMIRPFNIETFMVFFTLIFLLTIIGLSYMVHCRESCCNTDSKNKRQKVSKAFLITWAITGIVLLSLTWTLPLSVNENVSLNNYITGSSLPPVLQELNKVDRRETTQKDGYQEINLLVTSSRYYPNVIVAKKGIPLMVNIDMSNDAGCSQEVLFPEFKVGKLVPAGGSGIIEFTPDKVGEFVFRCSMDMTRGTLEVI